MSKMKTVQNCSHLRGLRIASFQTFDRCDLGQSGYRALDHPKSRPEASQMTAWSKKWSVSIHLVEGSKTRIYF
jgi:hypothetical protein